MKTKKEKPLTSLQQAVLDELKRKGNYALYMGYRGRFNPTPYWFMHGNFRRCTAQINALIKRGLITVEYSKCGGDGIAYVGNRPDVEL